MCAPPLLVIQSDLVTKSCNYGNVVKYEVPDHLHYSAIQIPDQTLTQESENPNYMTAELKGTLEMILPNPFILQMSNLSLTSQMTCIK